MGMVIKTPVIVMALYDIGRDNWDVYNVSYNTYLYWMNNTLSLNAKFVIYTEEKFVERIKGFREKYDPELKNTIIITKPLSELEGYKLYNKRLTDLMTSEEFVGKIDHNVPEMTKPLYNVIMFNKLYFLKNAIDGGYFNGDLFIWADAGGLRDNISFYENKSWPSLNKINQQDNSKATFFCHSQDFDIADREKEFYAMSQIRNIQGTAFFMPKDLIDTFIKDFFEVVETCITLGYIGSDEKIFDLSYINNKHKYNLIKCTWREYYKIFSN